MLKVFRTTPDGDVQFFCDADDIRHAHAMMREDVAYQVWKRNIAEIENYVTFHPVVSRDSNQVFVPNTISPRVEFDALPQYKIVDTSQTG